MGIFIKIIIHIKINYIFGRKNDKNIIVWKCE